MRKMKIFTLLLFFQSVLSHAGLAQNSTHTSGYVKDLKSGEPLIGANLWLSQQSHGVATNTDGYFNLTSDKNHPDTIVISYIGYQSMIIPSPKKDTFIVFFLQESVTLDEVTIYGENTQNAREQFGITTLSAQQIKQIPALLGETDVMRALQLTPGVQGGAEGQGKRIKI
jgi:hypothetical protein